MNGSQPSPVTPGFIISMVGLFDIALGVLAALFLDRFIGPPNEGVLGLTIGQLVGVCLVLSSIVVFFYGRRMGWQPKDGGANSVVRR